MINFHGVYKLELFIRVLLKNLFALIVQAEFGPVVTPKVKVAGVTILCFIQIE